MKIRRHIGDYNFLADPETGMTFRWGKTFDEDPLFAPVPELADISISNHCSKGCEFCYRDSTKDFSFMSLSDFRSVLESLKHPEHGNVFQVALGGGEPLEHPEFIAILKTCREFNVIPNFTTNGTNLTSTLTKELKPLIGAVAVSSCDINEIESDKINHLLKEGVKTNLHYVLSEKNIGQAVQILNGEFNDVLERFNAIVFLTYKPSGRANDEHVLKASNAFREFTELIDQKKCSTRIGFDACFVPILLNATKIRTEVIDSCEVGYFSVYIDENLNVSPCSFSNGKDSYNLREFDFYDIWHNKFHEFRKKSINRCKNQCDKRNHCKGNCPYYPEITICYKD